MALITFTFHSAHHSYHVSTEAMEQGLTQHQQITLLLWTINFQDCVHNSLPVIPVPSHINAACALALCLIYIWILPSYTFLGLSNDVFLSIVLMKNLYPFLISPMRAACPPINLLHLIVLIILLILQTLVIYKTLQNQRQDEQHVVYCAQI
jgi:hypothetical protein